MFIFIALAIFLISGIVYDIYIILKNGKKESISAYIIRWSKKYPAFFIPLSCAFGFLCGHLFWSMDTFDYLSREEIVKKCEKFIEKE